MDLLVLLMGKIFTAGTENENFSVLEQ